MSRLALPPGLFVVAALALLVLWPSTTMAQGLGVGFDDPGWVPHRVAVLPFELPIFLELGSPAEPLDAEEIHDAVRGHLARQPYFALVDDEDLRQALRTKDVAESLEEARVRLGYGQQHFFGFNIDEAIVDLTKARDAFESGYGEVIALGQYADTLQYLAFALLDRSAQGGSGASDDLIEAAEVMREMVRVAPYVVLEEGRQTAERVTLFREARASLLADRALRRPSLAHARTVAEQADLDYLVYVRVVQGEGGAFRAEVDIYDHTLDTYVDASDDGGDIALPARDSRRAADLVDARLSRFTSCVRPRPVPPRARPTEAGRVYLDVGFDYFVFLESPTRTPFDNLGAAVTVSYMFTDYLSAAARFAVSVSGEDRKADLQATFNTFRTDLALGLSVPLEWVRPFLHLGVELTKPTSFWTTRDIDCKTFGRNAVGCPDTAIRDHEFDILGGVFAAAGANVNMGISPLFLSAAVHFAFYAFPLDAGKVLNFPVGFDLGLAYRF